jgi:hypothetical protein
VWWGCARSAPALGRPANRPARWALSSLDYATHLLSDGDQPLGVLKARCGHLLPMVAAEHDCPPSQKCQPCALIFRADLDAASYPSLPTGS